MNHDGTIPGRRSTVRGRGRWSQLREGRAQYDADAFVALGYRAGVQNYIDEIGEHEAQHVEALTAVIKQRRGESVAEAKYDLGYTDQTSS